MNREALQHTGAYPDIYLTERNRLRVRLHTAAGEAVRCRLHYFSRTDPEELRTAELQRIYRDARQDHFETEITFREVARYQKYYFEISENGESVYLTAWGLSGERPEDGYFEFLYANTTDVVHVPEWSRGVIYYQIFPERFCNGDPSNDPPGAEAWGSRPTRDNHTGGDIRGIAERLDYLEQLGAECLYLTPIFEADYNHKYATTDYYRIDPQFGTKEDLRELVQKAHARGIRVILDGVFNHTGIHFRAFEDILARQEQSPFCGWYHITQFPVTVSSRSYECVGAYKYMPKLNTGNPEVRKFILDVMTYWVEESGIDGWRLDVADEVDAGVWTEARLLFKDRYPDCILLGETWGSGLRLMDGMQMDSIMNYGFRDAVRDYIACGSIGAKELAERMGGLLSRFPEAMNQALFNLLDSHDTGRFLFLADNRVERLRLAAVLQMMFVGAPSIYYGDEIGLSGDNDPDCRGCMIWEKEGQNLALLADYQRLAAIRKQNSCVRTGAFHVNVAEGRVFGFLRSGKGGDIAVLINAGAEKRTLRVPVLRAALYRGIFGGGAAYDTDRSVSGALYGADMQRYEGTLTVEIEAMQAKILKEETS
ncbi:glycoside hydrolase family 13 protein [Lachnoclostridium sp. Marseille-P6806]|uniref:glycoside hydrolase family 13 protein n=1 Tax=Lachnoclostridium sp. Marseille-P6806 TaxID=2364793 RepID=UPI001030B298|nr:glycoside hydrolase family 13 protein [Lachnoclostridium sp. Marseille-P6806]